MLVRKGGIGLSKIEEFENRVIQQGMNDDDFAEFQKLLKRVRGNFLKRQHCYTTAIQLQPENTEQGIKLINYGLANFEDGWFSTYNSYLFLGQIYETSGNYIKAYESYLKAQNVLDVDKNAYREELSIKLLWMCLHIDSFRYSAELEEYYLYCQKTDEFSKAFVNWQFRMAVATIVIALHYGRDAEAKQAYVQAINICKPNYVGKLQDILQKNRYKESLKTTPESLDFLTEINL